VAPGADKAMVDAAIARGRIIGGAVNAARVFANEPANVLTPREFAARIATMARTAGLAVDLLEADRIDALGMRLVQAVAQGSTEPPRVVVLRHDPPGAPETPVLALVGKGVTFDTGGISIKPAESMERMKHDMAGGAAVAAALCAIAELQAPCRVMGVIPAVENMPGGRATRPGDVVTGASGKTVEIINTDAEGRLILADALTYAERYEPHAVVDIATLTGSMVVALGHVASGVFSNSDSLARALLAAGDDAYDRAWQMPLWDDYQEGLSSNFADFANVAGRPGGSITAACFLSRFTRKYDWAHLDIAGTAWKEGKEKGATGRPVPLLATWLLAQEGGA
jgi:leucyl aminopeptidase